MATEQKRNLPALPDDLREELLREQGEQLTYVEIPRVKIMGAGAGLFEFTDTGETVRSFEAVILSSHGQMTLWDREFGDPVPEGTPKGPACSSGDGQMGRPREGFEHEALDGRASDGTELIPCETCPYNQWGSVALIGKTGKGKACTNQRAVYMLVPNRELPYELILSPTSLRAFDQYSANLMNQGIPLPFITTVLSQEPKQNGSLRWSQAVFSAGDPLSDDAAELVLEKRRKYKGAISPRTMLPDIQEADAWVSDEDLDDDSPF